MENLGFSVKRIEKAIAKTIIEKKHYSARLGIMWEAFGLYLHSNIVGVVCYGQPSAPIQKYAFDGRDFRLYELTRLVVDRGVHRNAASYLISKSLSQLKEQHAAVISYADSAHGHSGIVYQATNWMYTGATKAHDSLYLIDGVPTHVMTVRDKFGVNDPVRWAKENNIQRVPPALKHRYFYFLGTKKQKKVMRNLLRYEEIKQYPKSEKTLYDCGKSCQIAVAWS